MVRINTKIGADEVDEKHNKNSRKRKIAKIDAHQGNEQQRKIINNLPIPGETWELVLGWLSRDNLIHSTCFVPGMMGAFSMRILHMKGRRKLVSLDFDWKRRPNPNPQHACRIPHPNRDKTQPQLHVNNEQPFALPECTVPDNFVDFQFIRFRYFDQQVLLFMRCIRPLLYNVNIILNEPITRLFKSDSMAALAHTLPLCSSLNALTTKLGNLYELNMHHPRLVREPRMMVLTFEEHVPVKKIAVLAEWLTTPHQQGDNSPKLLVTLGNKSCTELHETIKQAAVGTFLPSLSIQFVRWLHPFAHNTG